MEPLISRKHRKVSTMANYIKHFLFLASAITAVEVKNYDKNKKYKDTSLSKTLVYL